MPRKIVLVVLAAFATTSVRAAAPESSRPKLTLIPQPVECRLSEGVFALSGKTKILHASGLSDVAGLVSGQLGCGPAIGENQPEDHAIWLARAPSLTAEAYRLDVTPDRITVLGGSPAAVLYGVQTLRQIVGPAAISGSARVPCLSIEDRPRFSWRGLMLDCSRTFQSLDYLRKTIDRLSFYKMNVLHLHLTDDQGWRMEIRKYPELTDKGAPLLTKIRPVAIAAGVLSSGRAEGTG